MGKTFLLAAFVLPGLVLAQQTSSLENLKGVLAKQEQALFVQYVKALDAATASLRQKGDLDAYLVVETEKKRAEAEKNVRAPADAKDAFRPAVDVYHKETASLLKKYIAAMEGLIKQEMQANRVDSAMAARDEKVRAEFLLAEAESRLPKVEAKPPDSETKPPTPSHPLETPDISGTWVSGITTIGIVQQGARWTANGRYRLNDSFGDVTWTVTGLISKNNTLSGSLTHTRAPKGFKNSLVKATLSADGRVIDGAYREGMNTHSFSWQKR